MVTDDKEDKNIMKKIQNSILGAAATLAACSLISAVLLCGCSKDLQEQQASNTRTDAEMCELALTVSCGEATKTDITHEGGATKLDVDWKSGDKLYVIGATDGYLGYVTLSGNVTQTSGGSTATFKGNIKGWNSSQVLHIYYLGDTDPSLSSGADTYNFNISDQLGTLAGIASSGQIAHGATASLAPGTKTIATSLPMSNLNAVVLFDLSAWAAGTTITGTYSSAKLNLKTGEFSTKTDGNINIAGKCTASTYVSFIPDTRALTFTQGSYSTPALANTTKAGCFYSNNGTAIDMPRLESYLLSGDFTVSAGSDGTQGTTDDVVVKFSKGNLQATYSTSTSSYSWSFATNQWDYIGNAPGNTTIDGQDNGKVVDLFGWVGTSGSLTGEATKYGICTSKDHSDYGGSGSDALKADWAAIPTLPQISGRKWKTMTSSEWTYLLKTRSVNGGTGEGHSYQRTTLTLSDGSMTVYGLIIAPDNFSGTLSDATTWDYWQTLETAGCVFLPAAGNRIGLSLSDVGSNGRYWSSQPLGSYAALYLRFDSGNVDPESRINRYYGYSVRLVSAAQ